VQHPKKLDVKDFSFVHLITILSIHYRVKCRSCSLPSRVRFDFFL